MTEVVSNVAFGGEGVLHTRNGVVFVHDTLPSEVVSVQITQQKKRFARAKLLEVVQTHPQRIPPKCPHFSVCGGCDLQHAAYPLQAELKEQWLRESLLRIGGLSHVDVPPIDPARTVWEYRRHITLDLKVVEGKYRPVFHGRDSSVFVSPVSCPLFSEESLISVHRVVEKLPVQADCPEQGRLQLMKIGGGKWLCTFHFRKAPKGAWEILRTLMKADPHCAGVKLKTSVKSEHMGLEEGNVDIAGLSFAYSPEAFVQTHPDQSETIYAKIAECIRSARSLSILDLYGGIGVTANLAAREGAQVTSVELNRAAVELAKKNFAVNGFSGGEFWCGDVADYLSKCDWSRFEWVIANPPREGISLEALQLIAASKKPLLLISCMPTTLARDIKLLRGAGYELRWVQGYDMFPQTTHFETVAFLIQE